MLSNDFYFLRSNTTSKSSQLSKIFSEHKNQGREKLVPNFDYNNDLKPVELSK